MKKDLTSIVIVHYEQSLGPEILALEMGSIITFTPPEEFEIILVDNSLGDIHEDAWQFWNKGGFSFQRIMNRENVGWVKGCNQGIDAAEGEFVILMNNDVVASINWLKLLKGVYQANSALGKKIGTVVPQAYLADAAQDLRTHKFLPAPFPAPMVTHFCAFFPRKVFDDVGVLDERFAKIRGYYSDDDLNIRLAQAGYTNLIAPVCMLHLKPHFYRGEYETHVKKIIQEDGPRMLYQKWGKLGAYWVLHKRLPEDWKDWDNAKGHTEAHGPAASSDKQARSE